MEGGGRGPPGQGRVGAGWDRHAGREWPVAGRPADRRARARLAGPAPAAGL